MFCAWRGCAGAIGTIRASQGVGLVLQYHLIPKTPNARDDMNHKAMDQIFHGTCGNRTHNSQ
ncbi:unnamed protein product, partial [Nesidiocoris tenuis]